MRAPDPLNSDNNSTAGAGTNAVPLNESNKKHKQQQKRNGSGNNSNNGKSGWQSRCRQWLEQGVDTFRRLIQRERRLLHLSNGRRSNRSDDHQQSTNRSRQRWHKHKTGKPSSSTTQSVSNKLRKNNGTGTNINYSTAAPLSTLSSLTPSASSSSSSASSLSYVSAQHSPCLPVRGSIPMSMSSAKIQRHEKNKQQQCSTSKTRSHKQHQSRDHDGTSICRNNGESTRDEACQERQTDQHEKGLLMAACFCLCCPMYRCALWLCVLEFLTSGYIWFHLVNHLVKTHESIQLHDALLFIILTGWLITLSVSAISICFGERKKRPDLIIPRIVQLVGLLLLGFLLGTLLIIYFSGASLRIENTLIDLYEYIFAPSDGEPLLGDKEKRQGAHAAIRLYFILLIPIDFIWVCYEAVALAITWRYWSRMKAMLKGNGYFQSVAVEPSPSPSNNAHQHTQLHQSKFQHTSAPPPPGFVTTGANYEAPPPFNPYYKTSIGGH